ncbi:MAG: ribosome biogenesis GTPase Der [Myxococcota bacterium]
MAHRPLIAIVGRPNVGKSRLFNRLTSSRDAIVEDTPGVTRDRQYGEGTWYGKAFAIVDTGGFEPDSEDILLAQMREQAQLALEEAELVFFVMDGRAGLNPIDQEIARLLRVSDKLVFPIINKIDGPRHESEVPEFYSLGFERLYPISAEHGYLVDELMDDILDFLPSVDKVGPSQDDDAVLKVAVVGKPNAGKSSLINRVLGEDRLLTSNIPGTTRDAIDTLVRHHNKEYLFIDTAGIRRKRSIALLLEKFAVVKAFKAIDRADVVLFVIDATQGLTDQDRRLINIARDKGRPFVLLVNKWDLIDKTTETAGAWVKRARELLRSETEIPVIFISALTGQRIHRIFPMMQELYDQWSRRIATGPLNRWFEQLTRRYTPPVHKGRKLKVYFMSQVAIRPPTFMVSVNYPEAVPVSYKRFLLNRLAEEFNFEGTPLKLFFRKHGGERGRRKQDRS